MGVKLSKVPKLNTEELTDSEALLLQLLRERDERIQELTDEVARLKGEKEKPKMKPSRLEPKDKDTLPDLDEASKTSSEKTSDSQEKKKRPGSAKRKKTRELPIHETLVIQPLEEIPPDSEFKGYQDYTVSELIIRPHNIRYRDCSLENSNGQIFERKAPERRSDDGSFWANPQKLSNLSIPSLPYHPTQTPQDDVRLGHRHLCRTVKPNLSRRQRTISYRKAGNFTSRLECIKLH